MAGGCLQPVDLWPGDREAPGSPTHLGNVTGAMPPPACSSGQCHEEGCVTGTPGRSEAR